MDKIYLVWDIVKLAREHRKIMEKRVCSLGIHLSQHQVLMQLAMNGACMQNQIAEALEVSAAAVAVSLKKLEKGGYIEKRISESDGRSNLIALTAKGEEVVQQSKLMFEEADRKMFEALTEEQQNQLHVCMEQIINNLKTMEDNQT